MRVWRFTLIVLGSILHISLQSALYMSYYCLKTSKLYCWYVLSQAGKWIETPCIRFIGHTISFLMFLTLILISTLAEGVTDTNKLSFFLTVHEKYSWYRNQSSQPLPNDFAIRVYSPDIITFLLSLWIFGKYNTPIHSICSSDVNLRNFVLFLEFTCVCYIFKDHKAFNNLLKNIKRFMLIYITCI